MIGASAASSNPSPYLNIRRNFDGREGVPVPSRLRLLSLDRRESRLYSKSLPIPHRASNALRFSPTHVNIPRSLQPLSPCLYSVARSAHAHAGHTPRMCASRNVCVIGKAGKGTSTEKGRRFWSCAVLRVASDREYPDPPPVPLSAPPRRMLVHFPKYLCSNGLVEYCGGRDESRLRLLFCPCKRIVDLISRYVGTLPSVADAIFDVWWWGPADQRTSPRARALRASWTSCAWQRDSDRFLQSDNRREFNGQTVGGNSTTGIQQ